MSEQSDVRSQSDPQGDRRAVLLVTHAGRDDIVEFARNVAERLHRAGVEVLAPYSERRPIGFDWVIAVPDLHGCPQRPDISEGPAPELVMVLGGDGTFLRAAEYARPAGAPILGVNLGHVGFLAETEPEAIDETVQDVLDRTYHVEERMTLDVDVFGPWCDGAESDGAPERDGVPRSERIPRIVTTWALNEVSLEKTTRERILEVGVSVDGHPLTSFGCDGVLCATPTGSTAYAFSAGGPIVWPGVEAILLVPNAAHALFARPLLTGPTSSIRLDVANRGHDAVLCADGRRTIPVPAGHSVVVRRGTKPVYVARVKNESFGDRLVARFQLPVRGFRDN